MALNSNAVTVKLGSTLICGMNTVTFDPVLDQLDTTSFCSEGVREFLAGLSSATIALSGDYVPADAGQVILVNAWKNKTLLTTTNKPAFLVDATNGFSGDAYVSGFSIGAAVDGKVTASFTLQLTGAITVVTA